MSTKPRLHPEMQEQGKFPPYVKILSYGGMIPFIALAAALWLVDTTSQAFISLALVAYGAAIASFLGAIHWGLAMRDPQQQQELTSYAWGVAPSLVAWLAVLSDRGLGLALLAILLWACYGVDRLVYPVYQLRHWLPMRLRLTIAASTSCLASAIGLLR